MLILSRLVIISLLMWLGNIFGWWQTTLVVAALFTFYCASAKQAILVSFSAGMLSWFFPIATTLHSSYTIDLANLIGKMLGLGNSGTIIILLLPMLIGGILALCSAWIITACKAVVFYFLFNREEVKQKSLSQ